MEDYTEVQNRLYDLQEIIELFLLMGEVLSKVLSEEVNHVVYTPNMDKPNDLRVVTTRVLLDSYNTWDH